ncbi:LLM class flavin-dependent oxidoreductase [Microbacterium sorbitolivorans]|uniref:LLM class flavin-dependent oxidoreductase n=1 Tax=Microbacterium sorbitolivorans TaxID=1867410 RepID=A0A367Y6D4_9MICO|nr:LLM class flavin-dependent oxidoreductase [Microbacterium sorbitolivorans]RCK61425.1 LLM class flavin-dependent oxidoreductase [Microbacterium sorbitolivorans]
MTKRRMHLGAHFPGVNQTTIWNRPESGSQIDPASFTRFAQTAERGLMDLMFLAEGLRLREHAGEIHDLDVVGRPDTLVQLAQVARQTSHIGLIATLSTTFNEPVEFARQLATLDALSNGRAGWNLVTSHGAFFGANFRRGGYLADEDRYERARAFADTAIALWDAAGSGDAVRVSDRFFDIEARPSVPPTPQGRPVIMQAGLSPEGRDIAVRYAETVFSPFLRGSAADEYASDLRARLVAAGRDEDGIKILASASFALGDTHEEALEQARRDQRDQVSPATAVRYIESIWGRRFDDLDADGPLPPLSDVVEGVELTAGRAKMHLDQRGRAAELIEQAEAQNLSVRDIVIGATTFGSPLVGTPAEVARIMDEHVQSRACHGFMLIPTITPTGLDRFVDEVVPELQNRGVYRTEYEGETFRDRLA